MSRNTCVKKWTCTTVTSLMEERENGSFSFLPFLVTLFYIWFPVSTPNALAIRPGLLEPPGSIQLSTPPWQSINYGEIQNESSLIGGEKGVTISAWAPVWVHTVGRTTYSNIIEKAYNLADKNLLIG